MSAPRKVTPVLLDQFERICRLRMAAAALPTDGELALEAGVTPTTVKRWMRRFREALLARGQPKCTPEAPFHVEQSNTRG